MMTATTVASELEVLLKKRFPTYMLRVCPNRESEDESPFEPSGPGGNYSRYSIFNVTSVAELYKELESVLGPNDNDADDMKIYEQQPIVIDLVDYDDHLVMNMWSPGRF